MAREVSAKLGYGKFQLFSLTAVGILVRPLGSAYLLPASRLLPQRGHDLDAAFLELSRQGYELVVLDVLDSDLPSTHRKGLALNTMAAVLLLSGLQLIPLVAAVLLGGLFSYSAALQ